MALTTATIAAVSNMLRSERRYLNKEFAEHAKAQDAAFENDSEQYYRHQARAERYAERADRAHERHMVREQRILKREALEHRRAEEAMNRGDAAGFAHHEYKAARYHNKAGRVHSKRHYPAPAGHSHHHHPNFRGELPVSGAAHEEVPMGAFGGVPPLGRAPISAGTVPALPIAPPTLTDSSTVTTMTSVMPPLPASPMMGTMGGYEEVIETGPTPYYSAPVASAPPAAVPVSLPPRTIREFDVVDYEYEFHPTNRPLGIAPEFRRFADSTYGPATSYW